MDLNITTTIINSNQENNQLLLNAIRNKFDAQTATEAAAFSPPKFNIPLLKIPENILGNANSNKTIETNKPASQLNQFLLKQLQQKRSNNEQDKTSTEFVLPQLKSSVASKFETIVKPQSGSGGIDDLARNITKLQVQEYAYNGGVLPKHQIPAAIDLTTALANRLEAHQGTPPTRDFMKSQQNDEKLDFEIPFIDCDRPDLSRKHRHILPSFNEYCITDISQFLPHHSLAEPSAIGRFLCIDDNKYMPPSSKSLSPGYCQQGTKHYIEPFRFETKSPDDLVLLALNKYQRRHYN